LTISAIPAASPLAPDTRPERAFLSSAIFFSLSGRRQGQIQPGQPNIAVEMGSAVATGSIVKDGKPFVYLNNGGQADALLRPCAILGNVPSVVKIV